MRVRACPCASVRPRRKCNVLSESLIRFIPGDGVKERERGRERKEERERERERWVSVQTDRFPPRNSKWTAVSDVGATEVRKYFSTFVTRPVYWFRQIVPERGSEIRDAHAKSRSTTKQRYKGMCKRKRERKRERDGVKGW